MALWLNQTTSSFADLVSKIDAFLTTAGGGNPAWTPEDVDGGGNSLDPATGEWAISKTGTHDDIEVAFQYDAGGTPTVLGIYQYISGSGPGNYNNANSPWAQTADSGNGAASTANATIATGRHVFIGSTPVQYWAFTSQSPEAVDIIVETSDTVYTGFGFGELDLSETNDWTGGAYSYGWKFDSSPSTSVAIQRDASHLLDGLANDTSPAMQDFVATLHCESLTNQVAGGKWAVVMGSQPSGSLGNDRQAAPKARAHFLGGFRGGAHAVGFGQFPGNIASGLINDYPIACYYWDRSTDDLEGPMGFMPNARGVLMRNFQPEDEHVVDGDTWVVFPTRQRYSGSGALTATSGYQGYMFRKN